MHSKTLKTCLLKYFSDHMFSSVLEHEMKANTDKCHGLVIVTDNQLNVKGHVSSTCNNASRRWTKTGNL